MGQFTRLRAQDAYLTCGSSLCYRHHKLRVTTPSSQLTRLVVFPIPANSYRHSCLTWRRSLRSLPVNNSKRDLAFTYSRSCFFLASRNHAYDLRRPLLSSPLPSDPSWLFLHQAPGPRPVPLLPRSFPSASPALPPIQHPSITETRQPAHDLAGPGTRVDD